jgi:hypothetical protein
VANKVRCKHQDDRHLHRDPAWQQQSRNHPARPFFFLLFGSRAMRLLASQPARRLWLDLLQ